MIAALHGRPGGLRLDSRPSCVTVRSTHAVRHKSATRDAPPECCRFPLRLRTGNMR